MSVQAGPTFKRYAANGVTTVFSIPFLLLSETDLQVTLNGSIITSGFTLTGVGSPKSSCTFATAPAGDLLFQLLVPFERLTDYQENGDFLSTTVNRDLDRVWLALKELRRDDGRALSVSPLEPEGIAPLPVALLRASRVLSFDAAGTPRPSTLTIEQIEQQPALALASAQAAAASAVSAGQSATGADESEANAAASAIAAKAAATSITGSAVPLFSVHWWPGVRTSIPAGFVPLDGQLLPRALYPDAFAGINAGVLPGTDEATWLANPGLRGFYTAGDGSTNFRVADLNGKFSGSIGAAFVRGDGARSPGEIRQDQFQGHAHVEFVSPNAANANAATAVDTYDSGATSGATGIRQTVGTGRNLIAIGEPIANGANGTPRTGTETFPTHAVGAWIIKLFGAVTNAGAADAGALATAYANLSSRITALEGKPALGYGQTTQDLTSSRVLGNPYTNSSGRSITISGYVNNNSGGRISVVVGGVVVWNYVAASGAPPMPFFALVPAGASYSVNLTAGSGTLAIWTELR